MTENIRTVDHDLTSVPSDNGWSSCTIDSGLPWGCGESVVSKARASKGGKPSNGNLYFGDNLDVLHEYVADESVDLIYLDPPFNSQAQYNVLFQTPKKDVESAQAQAFRDTWTWNEETEWAFKKVMETGGGTARFIEALRGALGESDMMAYLVMMAVRLEALHRKLKPTGSLFLHCDQTASHYLKVVLDGIFGPRRFLNEILWKRRVGMSSAVHDSNRFGVMTDTILLYAKGPENKFHPQYNLDDPDYQRYIEERFTYKDEATGRLFQPTSLVNPAYRPNLIYDYKGYKPAPNGWMITKEKMELWDSEGRLYFPKDKNGRIRRKSFADELRGMPIQNLWTDIPEINSQAQERLGYPTQKPLALLERIIASASDEGDLVLDPFCGCGTTIEAAEKSKRRWIGIDVAVHAVKVIEARLADLEEKTGRPVIYHSEGMPRDFESAIRLAEKDKYQFQWWANYLFNPHAIREQKKGADRGIDGELFFPNGPGRAWGRMLTSVKGGQNIGPNDVRAFAHVIDREKAQMGLFICLNRPTREMIREAAGTKFADTVHGDIPKLQIVAIEDWFKGKLPLLPPLEHLPSAVFSARRRHAAIAKRADPDQPELPFSFVGGKQDVERHLNLRMVKGAA
jgi:site-specific DNA-methyltransferase (adenine-specific)